jgi:hypothetical protein
MKNHSGGYVKTKETLPLEGGGKRVGVRGLRGIRCCDSGITRYSAT